MNHKIYYLLIASFLLLQCQPSDGTRLKKGMTISKSIIVSQKIFNLNGSDNLEKPVLVIEGNGITVDFNNAILQGSNDKSLPEGFYGLGILVKNGQNITIKNLTVRGYKIGLKAIGVDSLKLENCDFSYNYRSKIEGNSTSDLLNLNFKDKNIWKKHGINIYLKACNNAIIRDLNITESQNGLLLENCNNSSIYNNTIQFNSGSAISLHQSNENQIMHNKLDWNVRGDNLLERSIGSDAGGVLIDENSSNNIIAYNSATHCTNGISLRSSSNSYNGGTGNSKDNIIYGNDCSYAVHSGIKMLYSQNKIFSNIINDSNHGINAIFSNSSMIMGNALENNETGISLSNVQNIEIRQNELIGNEIALSTDLVKHADYHPDSTNVFSKLNDNVSFDHNLIKNSSLVFNINHSDLIKIVLNQFVNCRFIQENKNNKQLILKSNEENPITVKKMDNRSFLAYAPKALSNGINAKLTNAEQGKQYILMNEYGTYSFRYPKLWLRSQDNKTGEYVFALLGPYGNFKLKKATGVERISLKTGTVPSTIVVKSKKNLTPNLEIEFIGEPIETQFGEKYKKGAIFLVEWK